MENAKKELKQLVKTYATEGSSIRRQIQNLKWKATLPEVQKDASGRKLTGKRARKAFHRPETGLERSRLWDKKRGAGENARVFLLCLGLLKGRPYKTMEAKCRPTNEMTAGTILWGLRQVLSADELVHFPEAAVKVWLEGGEAPSLPKDPEPKEPAAPPPEAPSLMTRMKARLELWGFRWLQSCTS